MRPSGRLDGSCSSISLTTLASIHPPMTEHHLCRFPVLRASRVAAEGRFARSMRRAEDRLRTQFGTSMEGLPFEVKERFERRYRWQEWPYNHVCGAVAVVAMGHSALRADIYLARRTFPRQHPEHTWHLPRHGDEILLYATGSELLVMPGNNISYQEVAAILLDRAQHLIRDEGCGSRSATILVEPALEAIDLAWIHQQSEVKRRSRRTKQRSLL